MTVFSIFPSDLITLNRALKSACTKECGEKYVHFLRDVCHDRLNADSLTISCTPTNGSAVVGEYCHFAFADVINTSILDALLSCYDFTSEVATLRRRLAIEQLSMI